MQSLGGRSLTQGGGLDQSKPGETVERGGWSQGGEGRGLDEGGAFTVRPTGGPLGSGVGQAGRRHLGEGQPQGWGWDRGGAAMGLGLRQEDAVNWEGAGLRQ